MALPEEPERRHPLSFSCVTAHGAGGSRHTACGLLKTLLGLRSFCILDLFRYFGVVLFTSPGVYAWGNDDTIVALSGPVHGPPASLVSRTPVKRA